jgi:hypothetical protein
VKAVAEFVENSIDAGARNVTITRSRERGEHSLTVADDGAGVPKDAEGAPDSRYVATHICDSIKRRLKLDGAKGIQGEFGIGLLSFWTVGEPSPTRNRSGIRRSEGTAAPIALCRCSRRESQLGEPCVQRVLEITERDS